MPPQKTTLRSKLGQGLNTEFRSKLGRLLNTAPQLPLKKLLPEASSGFSLRSLPEASSGFRLRTKLPQLLKTAFRNNAKFLTKLAPQLLLLLQLPLKKLPPEASSGFRLRTKLLPFLLLPLLLTTGCVKHTQLLYFRNQSEFVPLQGHDINNQLRIQIQPDDVLSITVKALDQETAEPFNLFGAGQQVMGQLAINNPSLLGYLVDPNGNIDLPVLGRVNMAGLSIDEAKALIVKKLEPYLKDPVIIIRFMNFRFTVLGEVRAPRTISVPGERITILEAIGQAGDLTPYSNREKIMVIREQNGKREFGYVNIHSPDIFQSPYFYLQQNDIVYIEPIKEATAVVRDPIQETLPILSAVVSIAALVVAFTR
jgi:polysaccharide export outer membrane protein